jgi:hypothetical protein
MFIARRVLSPWDQAEPSATPTRLPRTDGFTKSPLGQLFINNHALQKVKKAQSASKRELN